MSTLSASLGSELLSALVGVISLVVSRLIQKYLPDEAVVLVPAAGRPAAHPTTGEQVTPPPAPKGDDQ